jgi:probable HAF family extracellular repeat protein
MKQACLERDEKRRRNVLLVSLIVVFWGILSLSLPASAQSLTWLGSLGGLGTDSVAFDVSADGSVVVGYSAGRAFRWTVQGGMQNLGAPPPFSNSRATAVSADGSVVVGSGEDSPGYGANRIAFRWTAASGLQLFLPWSNRYSTANDVSANGAVIVGVAENDQEVQQAFRWSASTGLQWLNLNGWQWSAANAISPDGRIVAGGASVNGSLHALRWVEGTPQQLWTEGIAHSVSADGNIVVGELRLSSHAVACRWVNGVLQTLDTPRTRSVAYGVSADGSVVVGESNDRAFLWTPQTGLQYLDELYANLLGGGSSLWAAYAISPNGRYIVGYGWNMASFRFEAFLLDRGFPRAGDVNRDGCVDDADLLQVLFSFGEAGYQHTDLNWDGIVDDSDLLETLFHFGSGC